MSAAFDTWNDFLGPVEGELSLDPNDSGNWTGGTVGQGKLVGTKYGISAAAHPTVDIANLTLDDAIHLRKTEYWDAIRGDELPGGVAFVLAEAAYGSGPGTAIRQMQAVVGTTQDGAFGPATMAALQKRLAQTDGIENFLWEYLAQRLLYEASLAIWPTYRTGWTRRLFHGMWHAAALSGIALPAVAPADALAAAVDRNTAAMQALTDRLSAAGRALI